MTDDNNSRALVPLIEALYRTVLLRMPDAAGLEENDRYFTDHINRGGQLDDLLIAFFRSDEFVKNLSQFLGTYAPSRPANLVLDQSQYGEVELLLRLMVNGGAAHRIVVDVGANGRERSNSYDLLRFFGWTGLLIEANPQLVDKINADFAGLDYVLVNTAVADREGSALLHIGVNDDVSSLSEQNARNWGATRGQVEITVRRLSSLLAERAIPQDFDLLSIDAEGEDIGILNDVVEHGWRPRWVVIEASYDYTVKDLDTLPFSSTVRDRYRIVAQTRANLILGQRDRPEWPQAGTPILTLQN